MSAATSFPKIASNLWKKKLEPIWSLDRCTLQLTNQRLRISGLGLTGLGSGSKLSEKTGYNPVEKPDQDQTLDKKLGSGSKVLS